MATGLTLLQRASKLFRRIKSETNKDLGLSPMSSRTNALRLQVESMLATRLANPFQYRGCQIVEAVSAGIPSLDLLTGGLPRGSLTEIYGPPCSGRTSLLISALASRTANSEVCALVDAGDSFDPHSAEAAGVRLKQLLWVRCRNVDQALRATDMLIQGGGFSLIALDLSDTPLKVVRHVPLQVWFRFRRAVEHTPTILMILEQESNAKTCASLVLRLRAEETCWSHTSDKSREPSLPHSIGCLLHGWKSHAEMIRSRVKRPEQKSQGSPWFIRDEKDPTRAEFEIETMDRSRAVSDSEGGFRQR
jgi:recombination protein RecA